MIVSTRASALRPGRLTASSRLSSSEPPSACSGVTLSTRREPTHEATQVVRITPTSGRISTGSQ